MKTFIVDAFTEVAFKGNPAGVCLVKHKLSDDQMLLIAQEFNLSETAFIEETEEEARYTIRYFSIKLEIPLCGHATLASAKVIFENTDFDQIVFTTIGNIELTITRVHGMIEMEFPIYETQPASTTPALLKALGINKVVNCAYNKETNILLLEIEEVTILRGVQPDFEALVKSYDGIHGILITAKSPDNQYDFYSRFFWPWSGTNEDPVTGGTHTFLAKYWSDRLGRNQLKSFQCSERTGCMDLEILDENKLLIRAHAVVVLSGELKI